MKWSTVRAGTAVRSSRIAGRMPKKTKFKQVCVLDRNYQDTLFVDTEGHYYLAEKAELDVARKARNRDRAITARIDTSRPMLVALGDEYAAQVVSVKVPVFLTHVGMAQDDFTLNLDEGLELVKHVPEMYVAFEEELDQLIVKVITLIHHQPPKTNAKLKKKKAARAED